MAEYHENATIILHVPIETVFAFVSDIENLADWTGAFDTIQDFSGNPVHEGTTWTTLSSFMGRKVISTCRITRYDAPHQIVFSIENMAGEGFNTWTLESLAENRTRFTLQLDGTAKGVAAMAVGLLRSQAEKQMNGDLANLKTILETRHT